MTRYGRASQAADDSIMRRRKDAICMPNSEATGIHSQCVILIALPREHWLCERASVTLYEYCPSCSYVSPVPTSPFSADMCAANHSRLDRMKCGT